MKSFLDLFVVDGFILGVVVTHNLYVGYVGELVFLLVLLLLVLVFFVVV